MVKMRILSFVLFSFLTATAHAQTVTESWLRQAGISCGGGLAVELQGEIDAAVLRRLRVAGIEGEGKFQRSEAETLLKQFQKEEKRQTYVDYVNCLLTLMNIATATSQLPPRDVVLDSPIAVASLETVKRGQRFVMVPGDTVAIKNHSQIFTVNKVNEAHGRRYVHFNWSNSESGARANKYEQQSSLIELGDKCTIVPYKIDVENEQVSFLSNC